MPKALCAACGRPVANLKSPTCVYCGVAVPAAVRGGATPVLPQGIPAEMLVMLEPRGRDDEAIRKRWLLRGVALALAVVMVLLLIRVFAPRV